MELLRLWYTFSTKCTAYKTLVNGWTEPPPSSNKIMLLFLFYLQMSDTAAVFSPNGNMDAMIFFAHIVLYDALVPILSCLYFHVAVLCVFKT